jgi:hypothetical protein
MAERAGWSGRRAGLSVRRHEGRASGPNVGAVPARPASSAGLPGGFGTPPGWHYDRPAGSLLKRDHKGRGDAAGPGKRGPGAEPDGLRAAVASAANGAPGGARPGSQRGAHTRKACPGGLTAARGGLASPAFPGAPLPSWGATLSGQASGANAPRERSSARASPPPSPGGGGSTRQAQRRRVGVG